MRTLMLTMTMMMMVVVAADDDDDVETALHKPPFVSL